MKNTNLTRRQFTGMMGALALGGMGPLRMAQAQNELNITTVVLGVPAGSLVDQIARRVATLLQSGYATNAVVENKTGASGIIAVAHVAKAAADGRTVLVAASSPITVYPYTYPDLQYDPVKDLQPITTIVNFDLAIAVGPSVPEDVKDLPGFFAWCKANPEKAAFGSPALGSMPHFLGSMTARTAGVDLLHVPYRGPVAAVADLVGGRVAAVSVPLVDLLEMAKAGRCRILAVTGEERSRFAPDVATFKEQGLGAYAMRPWTGMFLPAGTPEPVAARLAATMKTALQDPELVSAMDARAQEVSWCTPEALRDRIAAEQKSWAVAVKELNFSSEKS